MKALFVFAALSVILTPRFLFSQDEIKNYLPPEVIKGSDLNVSFNSSFSSSKSNYSGDKRTGGRLNFNGSYDCWKLTDRLNYAISALSNINFEKSNSTDVISNADISEERVYLSSSNYLRAGASYYFLKNKLYGGIFTKTSAYFGNKTKPYYNADFFPSIGFGKLVDAAEVTDADNFEKVLIKQKVISKPLSADVKKKLIELLDRRNNSEFYSKYKDDAEIEFYSQVERLLTDEGVISSPLSSRTTLKLFQTLSNSKFIFYPKYKGYQFQAEIDYTMDNGGFEAVQTEYFKSATLSAIYGLPINAKLSLLGTAFFTVPVKYNYLDDYDYYDFHSPISLVQYFQRPNYNNELVPFFEGSKGSESFSYKMSGAVDAFYNINSIAGANFHGQLNLAKLTGGAGSALASYEIRAELDYNILSKMILELSVNYDKSFYSGYDFGGAFRINYIIF